MKILDGKTGKQIGTLRAVGDIISSDKRLVKLRRNIDVIGGVHVLSPSNVIENGVLVDVQKLVLRDAANYFNALIEFLGFEGFDVIP